MVLEVGPGEPCDYGYGVRDVPTELSPGAVVVLPALMGYMHVIDGQEQLLVRDTDILAVVES